MDYRGQDLDLRTSRWGASSADQTGWREPHAPTPSAPSARQGSRTGPIWVDETLLSCANHAYDVALAYRAAEVRIEHLLLALTRNEAGAAALEGCGVRVASLRRDAAVEVAGEPPAAGDGAAPRRSHELEDVLRLAAARATHFNRQANVEDVVQILAEVGADLPRGELVARHIPRAAREYWSDTTAARPGQHGAAQSAEAADPERAVAAAGAAPGIDPALFQAIVDRLSAIEHAFAERIAAVEAAVVRLPLPPHVDLAPIENRLASIEAALHARPSGEGVTAIDPAITDRLWAIEHAFGTERTERASAVTALSDEISGVRSAVRLAAQNSEQAQGLLTEQLQQIAAALEQHRSDVGASLNDRIGGIEQTIGRYDRLASEAQSIYSAELSEVHEALMKISANQHTLAGAVDNWRNNDTGEIQLINTRIGAVHEDGARRLAALEQLRSDVETLAQLVLDEKSAGRGTFKQWLYGTEDWVKASWHRTVGARRVPRWPRFAARLPFKRAGSRNTA